ncbi:hypothetical protein [Rhodopseudomonas palustris]|uniref:Outer membrane protein beta-barrel domain-containing protein n=1 Tax=Rhodopseudomonas palustris (strain BisB18) TaxID=316056 RepID=Q211I6_RHOPB
MSMFASKLTFAVVVTLGLSAGVAQAQVAPVRYWLPGGLFGFGGNATTSVDSYSNFPSFDANAAGGGADWRDNFPTGPFLRGESGSLSLSGLGQTSAFGSFGALNYDSTQFGYAFKGAGGLPVKVFAGFDSLKYDSDVLRPLTPLSSDAGTPAAYSANVGFEIQPAANLSLSFGAGYTQQQSGRLDSDINSRLLPGESPLLFGGRR